MARPLAVTAAALISLLASRGARATALVPTADGRTAIALNRAAQPPRIDGQLDDEAWAGPPLALPDWVSYNPVRGQSIPQTTEVRVSYDDAGIYFAFHCLDPEPAQVRATLSRRDDLWNDDWVGVSLDALGSGQQTYDLFVNPRGVQADILNTATAGENTAPDWVWDSAGRMTEVGYDVEIRVPWKSIRFASGADVKMGILFWRRVSRLGMSTSWPALPADKPFFQNHAPLLLTNLARPLALEVVPSLTFARNEERVSPQAFGRPENEPDVGLSAKYGITSTTSLEATVNPDFSQVESDAYQVEVNQRYPLFYSEKRPFFMEGMGTFQLAGATGDSVMRTAVHTRRIIDPSWGAKTSGSIGPVTFATLAATDRAPGRDPEAEPAVVGKDALYLIGRGTWSLGASNYIGAIATDTELASGHNRVGGADFTLARGSHNWTGTFLASQSETPDGQQRKNGLGGQIYYVYDTKRWTFVSQAEHYDRDFRMDTAFLNQTGITTNWSWAQLSLYPDEKKHPWFKRFSPFVFTRVGHDLEQGGDQRFVLAGVQATFTRQLFVRIDAGWGLEPWKQREYRTRMLRLIANGQPLRWLSFNVYTNLGRSIYYDDEQAPFAGPSWNHSLGLTFQPGARFSQSVSWDRAELARPAGGRAYRVDVLNLKTTFQFDRRFALRGIVRYDSSEHRVLADFLGSFEPMPGTVAYVGYGSLYERRSWDGSSFQSGAGDYLTTRRGLFIKASYAKRF